MRSRLSTLGTLFFREAFRALVRHKMRSALTTLGITIGIAAVVLVVAIGQAGSRRAQEELAKLGDSLVWIEAGSRNVNGARTGSHGAATLVIEDQDAILREVPLIKRCSPQVDGTVQIIGDNHNWVTRYRGETPDYLSIKSWTVGEGRSFSAEDVEESAGKVTGMRSGNSRRGAYVRLQSRMESQLHLQI